MAIDKRLLVSGLVLASCLVGLLIMFVPPKPVVKFIESKNSGALKFDFPQKVMINQPFDVTLLMDTAKQNVNAVGVYIAFDPTKIKLLQMDTRASFCQFYPEKKFDNQLGTVSLACGSPHPGVNGPSTLIVMTFMPTSIGETDLRLSNKSQILKSDGKGTNILSTYPSAKLTIVNSL